MAFFISIKQKLKQFEKTDLYDLLFHSKNYFSALAAIRVLSLISMPIMTRLFTKEDYGTLAIFGSYVGIMNYIFTLNTHSAVGRYYYEKNPDFPEFVNSTITLIGLIFTVSVSVFILFHGFFSRFIQLNRLLSGLLIASCAFAIIESIYFQILIPQKRSKEASRINIIKAYAGFLLSLLVVYLMSKNRYLGALVASAVINMIFTLYYARKMNASYQLSFNRNHIRYILIYCLPLLPYSLSGVILEQFGRIMVKSAINTAAAGVYSVGYSLGMMMTYISTPLRTAVMPNFYEFMNKKEYGRIRNLWKRVFSFNSLAALGLILFSKDIMILLADKKFHAGASVIPIVVIGYLFLAMFEVYMTYADFTKKTIYSSINLISSGILNIILNVIFIPKYGFIAAAYSTAISYFYMFFFAWVIARFILKSPIVPLLDIWKYVLLMFVCAGIYIILGTLGLSFLVMLALKIVLFGIFFLVIFLKDIRTVLA